MTDGLEQPKIALDPDRPQKKYVTGWTTLYFGLLFLTIAGCLVWLLIDVLRSVSSVSASCEQDNSCWQEPLLIQLVLVAGALGAFIHAATSFATYVGNRQLTFGWIWWLLLRIPVGTALAVLVYFAVRAQFFGTFDFVNEKDVYLIGTVAGISGLFSKQVADKLSDLIDNLFTPAKKPERAEALKKDEEDDAKAPVIESFSPESLPAQALNLTVAIIGKGFADGAVVSVQNKKRSAEFVSSTRLTFEFEQTEVQHPAKLIVKVRNPDGRYSKEKEFDVT